MRHGERKPPTLFHVKHRLPSLPDAEIPENDIQQILDIDPTGDPAQRPGGGAEHDAVLRQRAKRSQPDLR